MKKIYTSSLLVIALVVTGCGQMQLDGEFVAPTKPATPTVAAPNTPVATAPPTAAATATPPADPAAECPTAGAGQALYVSRENGYCFLYPAAFDMQPDQLRPAQVVNLLGPGISYGQEGVAVNLTVASNGPADGLDSRAYAGKWLTAYRMDPNLAIEPFELNGQTAALIDNLPGGMFNQRQAFVAANGFKYQLTLSPRPEDEPQLAEAAEEAWDLMTRSLTLFAPAAPLPLAKLDEICPEAGVDTTLWVDEAQGFCLLYPAMFEPNLDFPGQIIGGPVLLETTDWGAVRTALTIAGYDQPPSEAKPPKPPEVNVDPASIETTTIGGGPAVTYDFLGAPWRQHAADILGTNGSRYTMVGPWDPQVLPEGAADAQRLWETVTGSIVFFEKWR